jgi:hypothetical protein
MRLPSLIGLVVLIVIGAVPLAGTGASPAPSFNNGTLVS